MLLDAVEKAVGSEYFNDASELAVALQETDADPMLVSNSLQQPNSNKIVHVH
jgi:hypothetical protein